MKLRISSAASVVLAASDEPVTSRDALASLHGLSIDTGAGPLSYHLADELLDRGVVGGAVTLAVDANGVCVNLEYASPAPLSQGELDLLLRETLGQWSDGAGESGFEVETPLGMVVVQPSHAREDSIVSQIDDGRPVPGPPVVANLAWRGSADEVRAALAAGHSVNAMRGGYTPLRFAILRGNGEVAILLIDAGADVLADTPADGPLGGSLLQDLATARDLSDEDAAHVAHALLKRGVRDAPDRDGRSAAQFAEIRGKTLLLATLRAQL